MLVPHGRDIDALCANGREPRSGFRGVCPCVREGRRRKRPPRPRRGLPHWPPLRLSCGQMEGIPQDQRQSTRHNRHSDHAKGPSASKRRRGDILRRRHRLGRRVREMHRCTHDTPNFETFFVIFFDVLSLARAKGTRFALY